MTRVLTAGLLLLLSRMLVVAAIVVAVSVVVARSGPFLGAMVAAIPVSAGPAYVFIALDHGPDFVVRSTIASILAVSATAPFVVAQTVVSRVAGTVPTLLASVAAFVLSIYLCSFVAWTLLTAFCFGMALVFVCILLTGRARREAAPIAVPSRWSDLVIRAGAVMSVVAAVMVLGELLGPTAAGYGALMPVVFTSMIIVLQPQVGGAPVAGILAHALFGIMGFMPAFALVNLGTTHLGLWWGLTIGLVTSLAWNTGVVLARRHRLLR